MPVHQGVWGIDVGQSALKALRLEVIDGVLTATAFDYVEHPKILSQPDADPDQLTREALDKFLSRNTIKGDLVAVSVPGQSGLARFVKLPPVEEKKIGDIVRFEAKQQIPFPLEEVVWDYQKIGSGEVTDGFAMETEIGLFAMKRDQINRSLSQFQDVKVEVHVIQMAPLALCNYVAYDLLNKGGTPTPAEDAPPAEDEGPRGKRRCVVALDIGTDSSNLVITDGEKIIWQRPIPLGGNHLTRALSKELKLTFAKAEHLKRNAAKSPPELKTILSALKPVLTDFVGEVQRSLGFFTNSHREATIVYMVGLGSAFRLPGLQKYLQEKLQLEVRKPSTFTRLVGDDVVNAPVFTENVLGFAVPYGLAVQGLGLAKLHTNLLPQEIQFDRMIRAKKPWAIAAASALFLGTGLLTTGYAINYRAVNAAPIETATKQAKSTIGIVGSKNGEDKQKEGEVTKVTNEVKGVIAGKEEQLNWLLLNKFIAAQLPQPDGSNLPENPRQQQYWNTDLAKRALREYQDRVRGGQTADQPMPDDLRENLVLVDVEAVNTMYTDNLKTAFDGALREVKVASGVRDFLEAGMCRYDAENPPTEKPPPDGGGWIIEIRGSTYHKAGRQFILDTLLRNITVNGRKDLPLEPAAGAAAPGAPPAAPGAPPAAAPGAADGKPAASAQRPDDEQAMMNAIIKDRVRYAFLYRYQTDPDPKPGAFKMITGSFLKDLAAPTAAAAPGPGGAQGAPVPGGDGWEPLTGSGGSNPSTSSGHMGRGGKGDMNVARSVVGGRGEGGPGAPPPRPAPGSSGGTPAKAAHPRTEFVVMFFWQEPTPSDQLMNLTAAQAPAAAQEIRH
ncbi:MAG TPA: type IV pilus assembly protein PilM [Gemmataceae bacterium]|nr:type IV pilus assembly protein PilM [Gemmataceae bacterium]